MNIEWLSLWRRDHPLMVLGVGTALSTVADAPALSGVYKLVEIERDGRMVPLMKLSDGKRTLPGSKQVWRVSDLTQNTQDVVGLADELGPKGALPLNEAGCS